MKARRKPCRRPAWMTASPAGPIGAASEMPSRILRSKSVMLKAVRCAVREHFEVQALNFGAGPGCASQELEAGFDRRVIDETLDADAPGQTVPAVMRHQAVEHHLKGDAVQRVVDLLLTHLTFLRLRYPGRGSWGSILVLSLDIAQTLRQNAA